MSYQNQILGTIISSVLNYDQFTETIGETPAINNKTSSYVPCDGRSIIDSKLELLTKVGPKQPEPKNHIVNAPDLRGRFVRGLNQFYSVGEPVLDISSADPDGTKRKVGEYQSDDIKPHSHAYSHIKLGYNPSNDGGQGHNEVDVFPDEKRTTDTSVGNESRPRNIALYFYIKIN